MKQFLKQNALLLIGFLMIMVFFLSNIEKLFKNITGLFKDLTGNGVEHSPLDDSNSTFTNAKASQLAESLYVSMYEFGTDEDRIFQLLKGINKSDFAKVYNAFGKRYYMEYFGTWSDSLLGVELDLFSWFENELSASDYKYLKSITDNAF